ncbi:MAG: hypothetical protein AB2L14_34975 [Candidatus Xenobiia bacterium LiM19]
MPAGQGNTVDIQPSDDAFYLVLINGSPDRAGLGRWGGGDAPHGG